MGFRCLPPMREGGKAATKYLRHFSRWHFRQKMTEGECETKKLILLKNIFFSSRALLPAPSALPNKQPSGVCGACAFPIKGEPCADAATVSTFRKAVVFGGVNCGLRGTAPRMSQGMSRIMSYIYKRGRNIEVKNEKIVLTTRQKYGTITLYPRANYTYFTKTKVQICIFRLKVSQMRQHKKSVCSQKGHRGDRRVPQRREVGGALEWIGSLEFRLWISSFNFSVMLGFAYAERAWRRGEGKTQGSRAWIFSPVLQKENKLPPRAARVAQNKS